MEQFNTIPTSGNWADIAGILDANFLRCWTALVQSQSLIGLDGSNYKGMYTSASALPDDMTEAGWALVGSSLSALQLYVFNDGATDWALFSNETYNFTSWTEFQTQLDALSTQVATIGSKLGDLTQLQTTEKTNLVDAINEVKAATEDLSGDAADINYTDNYGMGVANVQDAIDNITLVGYEEVLTKTPELTSVKSYASTITAGTAYRISFSNVSEGSKVSVSIGSSSATTEATSIRDTIVTEGMSVMYTPSVDATHWRMYVATALCTISIEQPKTIKDVDAEPQKGSKSLVSSGGVYAYMPHMISAADATSSEFEEHARNLGDAGKWHTSTSAKHIVVPVIVGTEITFTCVESSTDGNWYTWLTDAYVPPTSASAVPYVSGYSRVWGFVNTEYNFTVPEGAAYLMLGTVDGNGNTAKWSIRYETYRELSSVIREKADILQLNADKTKLESEIEKAKYNLSFDDVWSTNDASVIYPTRDGDNIVVTIISKTGLKRCGFDISEINVGETILIEFTSEVGIVFGFGETLGSAWAYITTAKSPFYFTKTSTTQKYIYIPANSYEAGVVLTLVGFKVYRNPNALEIDIDTLTSYSFQPSSYIPIKEGYERYMSISVPNGQGSTIYGDYFVNGFAYAANYKYIKIYNLLTKELAQQVDLPTLPNTRYHANTISFSGTKYDNADVFPLLYICSGYTDSSSVTTSEVYVVRIIGVEGEWTTELVQTIYLDFGTWTEWVCDPVLNRAWINGSGIDKYICVAIPDITESEVTINADTPIIDHFNTKTFTLGLTTKSSGQGRFFYHNRIYWVSGVPSYAGEGDEALYVVVDNTLTHCTEAVVPLKNFGLASGTSNTYEPEGCFIWNDEFYVAYRSFIAKLIQNKNGSTEGTSRFYGKHIAIVGDSISTFSGYIPSGWRNYYTSSNLGTVENTYWHQVCNALGMTYNNCSYSASRVSGNSLATASDITGASAQCAGCSDARIDALDRDGKTPNIILIALGTNDWGNNVALGEFDDHSTLPAEGNISTFAPAYALMLYKMQVAYPSAQIFCCTALPRLSGDVDGLAAPPCVNSNGASLNSFNDKIKEIANIFGCNVIDLFACGLNFVNIASYAVDSTLHPNANGHTLMANKIIAELKAKY